MCASAEKTTELIADYLKSNDVYFADAPWEIRRSPLGDRGVFAARAIEPGELIFIDCPIIIGPRVRKDSPKICVVCNNCRDIRSCAKHCGLPVCSESCEESSKHEKECRLINRWNSGTKFCEPVPELVKCLTPIRYLCLSETHKKLVYVLKSHVGPRHGFEVDILKNKLSLSISEEDDALMRLVCSVLDANAFEVLTVHRSEQFSLKGLYSLGSLVNHNCSPNTIHVFDDRQRMVVRAAVFIPKDAEIFHCYTRLIWSTLTRRHHLLLTKHFCCRCERCCDPSEFGGYLNALKCESCKGLVLPIDPLKSKTQWACLDCKTVTDNKKIGFINSLLGRCLRSLEDTRDVDSMIRFWKEKLSVLVHETNHIVAELKYMTVWILGHEETYLWTEISDYHLQIKEEICRDLLRLLQIIRTGMCKMRGLLLYELYECLKEKRRRMASREINNNLPSLEFQNEEDEMGKLLSEASEILLYDVGAPAEVKNKWQTRD